MEPSTTATRLTPPFTGYARRRKELNIDRLARPMPTGLALGEKQEFAGCMILDEIQDLDPRPTTVKNYLANVPRNFPHDNGVGDLLRGMMMRGRFQAAVFNVFMKLCARGLCSLSALEHPMVWHWKQPTRGTCLAYIWEFLGAFEAFRVDWVMLQKSWGIKDAKRWLAYLAPRIWLATAIRRSFTNLEAVFDLILSSGQLGFLHPAGVGRLIRCLRKDEWVAAPNMSRAKTLEGGKTFAFWLPMSLDRKILEADFDDAARVLSKNFYHSLDRLEMHYATFFDITREEFDADILPNENLVRIGRLQLSPGLAREPPVSVASSTQTAEAVEVMPS